MKLENLKVGTAYHCDTKEKARELLGKLHELGYRWNGGRPLSHYLYGSFGTYSCCYFIKEDKRITNGSLQDIEDDIVEIEYILDKDCPFEENWDNLKQGYLVQTESGSLFKVEMLANKTKILDNDNVFFRQEDYTNFKHKTIKGCDIVKVYGFPSEPFFTGYRTESRELLYQEKEPLCTEKKPLCTEEEVAWINHVKTLYPKNGKITGFFKEKGHEMNFAFENKIVSFRVRIPDELEFKNLKEFKCYYLKELEVEENE